LACCRRNRDQHGSSSSGEQISHDRCCLSSVTPIYLNNVKPLRRHLPDFASARGLCGHRA
jgi:hypothetical protein